MDFVAQEDFGNTAWNEIVIDHEGERLDSLIADLSEFISANASYLSSSHEAESCKRLIQNLKDESKQLEYYHQVLAMMFDCLDEMLAKEDGSCLVVNWFVNFQRLLSYFGFSVNYVKVAKKLYKSGYVLTAKDKLKSDLLYDQAQKMLKMKKKDADNSYKKKLACYIISAGLLEMVNGTFAASMDFEEVSREFVIKFA